MGGQNNAVNQDKKITHRIHSKIKTNQNFIGFHQTPLFNPKGKTLDTQLMATTIQDINREILNSIHPDLLIQIVLIHV